MFNFPWSNFHELNLDWILSVVKEAKEVFDDGRSDIDYAVSTADEAKEIATQAAEATIADNSISTQKLQNGAVTNAKLANNSVTTANIVDRTIIGNDIAENTIESYNIKNGTIIEADMADEAVTSAKIAPGSVTYAKLADDAVNTSKITDGAIIASKLSANLKKINLHGYHLVSGRSDGAVAISVPMTGIYSNVSLAGTPATFNADLICNGTATPMTLTYDSHSYSNGYLWLKFIPSSSITQLLPVSTLGMLSIRDDYIINLI